MAPPDDTDLSPRPPSAVAPAEELPVVARLVVEIRSDGTRTVARGAVEDHLTGEQVALRIEGTTPAALAAALARSLLQLPALTRGKGALRRVARKLLPGRKG
jgi:hypothetical protein